ncbi:Sjogren's syndrome/scleroderma autoantigen 1 family protein [Natrarchaeobius sp. A-rgal3]|uniref:Sjogren's syndrome/scleroderma autoantigen 1 family protein n=1 Tax=Natrarchaeobius versutus TaxID=1679078 RepID=UPI00350F8A84
MSDFDKEAEREKLRKKYERDKKEREATQRMSDLLLKGATMTNSHCGTCGDPLFKQNGTTFCPSCHGSAEAVEGTDLEAQSTDEASTEEPSTDHGSADGENGASQPADVESIAGESTSSEPLEAETTEPDRRDSETARPDQPSRQDQPSRSERARTESDDHTGSPSRVRGSDTSRSTDDSHREAPNTVARSSSVGNESSPPVADESAGRRPAQPAVDGDLEAARDSLVRALEKFAGEAAAADDPRHARECLEAAREASETLNALR